MSNPPLQPEAPRRPRTILEIAILVIGGWVATTIGRGLLMSVMPNHISLVVALGGVLNLTWYALLAYEGYHWFAARRAPRLAAAAAAPARPERPLFGIVSIASIVLVWLWVGSVFIGGFEGSGESAQIGLFAAGFLTLVGLIVGLLSGIASRIRKEPPWVGLAGIGATLATAATFYYLLQQL